MVKHMYAIEKELKILREFIRPEFINDLKKWKCYSEDEISAAEKRLHAKLPVPIRDIYRHMADLLITSGYLRPLELLHWEGRYLGFFPAPGEGDIIGIKKGSSSGDLYAWEEHTGEPACLFSDFFPAEFSMEYFQKIADRIRDDFKPLSDHPELIDLGGFPLQMAYVHKDQKALLILGQKPVCFMLLTKGAAGPEFLKKLQEQTSLAFHAGF